MGLFIYSVLYIYLFIYLFADRLVKAKNVADIR